jgi:hypothetical protein
MMDSKFLGLIVSCFNEFSKAQKMQLTCFQSERNENGLLVYVESKPFVPIGFMRANIVFMVLGTFIRQTNVPVFIEPVSHVLDKEGAKQFVRIPQIFLTVRYHRLHHYLPES